MNLLNFNWKKRHFNKKIRAVEAMIIDLEFKKFKAREIREEIRQAYDTDKARLSALDTQIEITKDKAVLANLKDTKEVLDKKIGDYEKQINGLDLEIIGSKKTSDYPDGIQGINDQIEALRELVKMIKNYINILD